MKLYQLPSGDEVHRYKKSLVICFAGERKVLGTGPNNGGYRTDLKAVFNHDCNPGPGISCELRADTYPKHMDLVAAQELGLDAEHCTGLMTAASMENVSIQSMKYEDFTVTALVTGGIRNNGGRVGDPAVWHEKANISYPVRPGTINILVHIDANLSEGALARAMVTCTEAKTAALQELLAPSRYSRGIATGSGTDGMIVICNAESDVYLTNAGKHCKLGEYIGKTVKKAVKEALYLQSGLSPEYQYDIFHRMDRFGVTEDALWERYEQKTSGFARAHFSDALDRIRREDELVVQTSLYAHLLDQTEWGMLKPDKAWRAGKQLLRQLGWEEKKQPQMSEPKSTDVKDTWIMWMTECYMQMVLSRITLSSGKN